MSSYIYRLYAGADPATGWMFNDPIFGKPSTLGACVPNLRRNVEIGDWVFCISGRIKSHQPYVVGGFRVAEKLHAMEAHQRFPQFRLRKGNGKQVLGNIIVDETGRRNELDTHTNFESRLSNYLVGDEHIFIQSQSGVARAREETLSTLSKVFDQKGNRCFDIVPRWRKLGTDQVDQLRYWLADLEKL